VISRRRRGREFVAIFLPLCIEFIFVETRRSGPWARALRCNEFVVKNTLKGGVNVAPEKFDYTFHQGRDWKHYEVYLKRFRNNPSPILELGSGIGLFLEACRHNGVAAVGLEYEPEGVEAAKRMGLDARQHDLGIDVPFEDASFEAVFSNQVIEHLPPLTQARMISEAYRVLKPGGQVLIISPCRHYEPARLDKYHIGLLTPSEIKAMIEAAGFVNLNMGYNRQQQIDPVLDAIIKPLFDRERYDLLSQDATVLAWKPI
jgi:SAM-dependent methyltransferase